MFSNNSNGVSGSLVLLTNHVCVWLYHHVPLNALFVPPPAVKSWHTYVGCVALLVSLYLFHL